jgi:hypothetical protein
MCSSSHRWARIGGGKKLTVNRVGTQAHSPIHEGDEQELEKVAVVVWWLCKARGLWRLQSLSSSELRTMSC